MDVHGLFVFVIICSSQQVRHILHPTAIIISCHSHARKYDGSKRFCVALYSQPRFDDQSKDSPLFLDTTKSTAQAGAIQQSPEVPVALLVSMERVKQRYIPNSNNINGEATNKLIVQAGMEWNKKQSQKHDESEVSFQFPNMERVSGCIASVHLQTTLLPITSTSNESPLKVPRGYRLSISGTSDAMLSGGLLALLSDVLSGKDVAASDVLHLDRTMITSAMGLESLLSRGRNDGMASMVKVVQSQIRNREYRVIK